MKSQYATNIVAYLESVSYHNVYIGKFNFSLYARIKIEGVKREVELNSPDIIPFLPRYTKAFEHWVL